MYLRLRPGERPRDTIVDCCPVVLCAGVFRNCFISVWQAQSERATLHCACADYSEALPCVQTLVKGA